MTVHHPKVCNYYKCGADVGTRCPFLADAPTGEARKDKPKYVPGQAVMLNYTYTRRAIVIAEAAQNADGNWVYYDYQGNSFREGDVEIIAIT